MFEEGRLDYIDVIGKRWGNDSDGLYMGKVEKVLENFEHWTQVLLNF